MNGIHDMGGMHGFGPMSGGERTSVPPCLGRARIRRAEGDAGPDSGGSRHNMSKWILSHS